jgi:hypothetical protein
MASNDPKPPMDIEKAKRAQACENEQDKVKRDQCYDNFLKEENKSIEDKQIAQGGMYIGIAVGVALLLVGAIFLISYLVDRAKKEKQAANASAASSAAPTLVPTAAPVAGGSTVDMSAA